MDQLRKLILSLSLRQRVTVTVGVLLAGFAITFLVHWRHESDFSPLYTAMAPEDAAAVVQKLKESGVEYRLSERGSAVLVPSAKLAESRLALAAAGLPKTGRIGFELFDKSNFGATDFVEHINYKRALEGELERSVMSLAAVEQARVHIMLPKESIFLDQQQPSKASVMVKLHLGAELSQQSVLAITNLVASAVEGLAPEAVAVINMDGTLLTRRHQPSPVDGGQAPTDMLEMRQFIEHNLVAKISETLEPLLGPGGFRTGASVEYDLTSGEQQEESLDPTRSVMVNSQRSEDVSERTGSSGIPGTASNLPGGSSSAKTSGGVSRRTESITYQTSRVIRHTHIPQGIIKRMSLAVLIDQKARWEGEGNARRRVLVPPSPDTLKMIKDLVAGVTGFSADRGDQLIVETLPFESSLNADTPLPGSAPVSTGGKNPLWMQWVTKFWFAPAGAVVVLAAVLVIWLMRRRRVARAESFDELTPAAAAPGLAPTTAALSRADQLAANMSAVSGTDSAELAERIRELAKREPAVTANTLRMWLAQSGN